MKIKNWTACVQDREKWKKEVVEKAKTLRNYRKFSAWKKKITEYCSNNSTGKTQYITE